MVCCESKKSNHFLYFCVKNLISFIEQEMCLWNMDAPHGNKVKLWQKFLSPTFLPRPAPKGHMISVKCEQPLDELTVQVWLLYHHPNFKYCTLFIDGTELRTDRRTIDPNTRCPQQTFQPRGIKITISKTLWIAELTTPEVSWPHNVPLPIHWLAFVYSDKGLHNSLISFCNGKGSHYFPLLIISFCCRSRNISTSEEECMWSCCMSPNPSTPHPLN